MNVQKHHLIICAIVFAILIQPIFVFASSHAISVTPVVMHHKAMGRDLVRDTITIRNSASYRTSVYVFVNNVAPEEGTQEFVHYQQSDKTRSLANWIEIPRSVVALMPGEERAVDLRIDVHPNAEPGVYHAAITFAEGSRRDDAEKKLETAPRVMVSLEVGEDIRERMQLVHFAPEKNIFLSFPASFTYEVENIGNRPQEPRGTVRIYNRRGVEVAEIDAVEGAARLEPDGHSRMASAWQGAGPLTAGRYRAVLNLEYGERQTAMLQDTVYFWMLPWPWLAGMVVTLFLFAILLAYVIHAQYEKRYALLHHHYKKRMVSARDQENKKSINQENEEEELTTYDVVNSEEQDPPLSSPLAGGMEGGGESAEEGEESINQEIKKEVTINDKQLTTNEEEATTPTNSPLQGGEEEGKSTSHIAHREAAPSLGAREGGGGLEEEGKSKSHIANREEAPSLGAREGGGGLEEEGEEELTTYDVVKSPRQKPVRRMMDVRKR